MGFQGALLPLHPGNAMLPSTTQCPAGMLAFGDRVPIAAIPYVVHVCPPRVNTLRGFSCLQRPREPPRCIRSPCSTAVYFPISLHQEILAGAFLLAASFTVEVHKTSPLMPK